MSIGPWQIILVVLIIVLLFGRGKISEVMGDFAKGIRSFKKGLTEDEIDNAPQPKSIDTTAETKQDAAPTNRD